MSFAGAVKTFGAVRAVDGVDLEIGPWPGCPAYGPSRRAATARCCATPTGRDRDRTRRPERDPRPGGHAHLPRRRVPGPDVRPTNRFPGWLRDVSQYTPTHRFAELGTSVADGRSPAPGAIAVLTVWLLAFGSYAVVAYRRTGRTV